MSGGGYSWKSMHHTDRGYASQAVGLLGGERQPPMPLHVVLGACHNQSFCDYVYRLGCGGIGLLRCDQSCPLHFYLSIVSVIVPGAGRIAARVGSIFIPNSKRRFELRALVTLATTPNVPVFGRSPLLTIATLPASARAPRTRPQLVESGRHSLHVFIPNSTLFSHRSFFP